MTKYPRGSVARYYARMGAVEACNRILSMYKCTKSQISGEDVLMTVSLVRRVFEEDEPLIPEERQLRDAIKGWRERQENKKEDFE